MLQLGKGTYRALLKATSVDEHHHWAQVCCRICVCAVLVRGVSPHVQIQAVLAPLRPPLSELVGGERGSTVSGYTNVYKSYAQVKYTEYNLFS